MKKLLVFIILIAATLSLSAQGRYMTRQIENNFDRLNQPPFAALSFADSTVTQALTADTWSVISEFVEDASNDVTTSDDTITMQKDGGYAIDAGLTFSYGAGDTLQVQLFDGATAFGPKYVVSDTIGAVTTTVHLSTYRALSQGDIVSLKMRNITDATDATVMSGSLFIRRIYH